MDPSIDEILSDLWYNLENKSAFGGVERLYSTVKEKKLPYSKKLIKKWLSGQKSYTLHFPLKIKIKRNKILSWGIDWLFEADLAHIPDLKWATSNHPWILVCICTFSKYLWAIPMKTKRGEEVADALKQVLKQRKPVYLRTDFGTEFWNQHVGNVLKENGVRHYGARGAMKAAQVERAIKHLKSKIYKYFSKNKKSRTYINDLKEIVHGINNTRHSSHGFRPIDVDINNQQAIFEKLYPNFYKNRIKGSKPLFQTGDKVRISKLRTPFQKGFRENFTKEIFEIIKVVRYRYPPVYKIKSLEDNAEVMGTFYAEEMVKVDDFSSQ